MLLKDRYDAAMKLIPLLEKYKNSDGIVLAVPRGGIPIGYFIATHFNFPLEPLFAKKIGHPHNKELAIGAVSLEDYIINSYYKVSGNYIENEIKRIRELLKERQMAFWGSQKQIALKDKTVIIVDDGIATGNTLLATIQMIRNKWPQKIVVAVPVSPVDTAKKIKREVDDFICLHEIEDFMGVGFYYRDFSEVSDEMVISLLRKANQPAQTA
jgi:predicted phosphoribosyltransferase